MTTFGPFTGRGGEPMFGGMPLHDPAMDNFNNAMNPTQFGDGGGIGCNTQPYRPEPGLMENLVSLAPPVATPMQPEPTSLDLMQFALPSPPPLAPAPSIVLDLLPQTLEPEPFFERPDMDRVTLKIGRFDDQ